MPRITSITPQKREGFFNIFIDGKFFLSLSAAELVSRKIEVGDEISPEGLSRISESALFGKMFNLALLLISRRPHSREEVVRHLKKRFLGHKEKISPEIIGNVVKRLEGLELINDERFARWFFQQRTAGRGAKGKSFIRQDLSRRGVSREVIEKILGENDETDWKTLAKRLAEKRQEFYRDLPNPVRRRRLVSFLVRRGFSFDIAAVVVDEVSRRE